MASVGDPDTHESTGGHQHDSSARSSRTLGIVAAINLLGFLSELAGGLLFGSVALLSDAAHMLFDALAYVMAYAAASLAERYEPSERWSYGLHRLEPTAAFLNGVLLIPMVGYILWEAYQRFQVPVDIGTGPTIIIAFGGLLINIGSVYLLQGDAMSLNEKGAFYHLLGDTGGSLAVIASTLIIEFTGIKIIDPLTAGLIAVLVLWSASTVLRGSSAIFFHKTPISHDKLRSRITELGGVTAVVDLHVWQICSQIIITTMHVQTSADSVEETEALTDQIHDLLDDNGVNHATIEVARTFEERDTHLTAHEH